VGEGGGDQEDGTGNGKRCGAKGARLALMRESPGEEGGQAQEKVSRVGEKEPWMEGAGCFIGQRAEDKQRDRYARGEGIQPDVDEGAEKEESGAGNGAVNEEGPGVESLRSATFTLCASCRCDK